MARTYFGTDGIRGKANEGSMTPEVAFRLGAAVTYQARQRVKASASPRGRQGHPHFGLPVRACPFRRHLRARGQGSAHRATSHPRGCSSDYQHARDAGVMISASHNPYQDNGLKVFGSDGFKLPDDEEEELERLMQSDELDRRRPNGMHIGRAERIETAWGRYVQFIKGAFPSDLTLDGLKVVVDAAHGARTRPPRTCSPSSERRSFRSA